MTFPLCPFYWRVETVRSPLLPFLGCVQLLGKKSIRSVTGMRGRFWCVCVFVLWDDFHSGGIGFGPWRRWFRSDPFLIGHQKPEPK